MKVDFTSSALIVVDVQNDFCPGGALEVEGVDEVIEPLNRLASLFGANSGRVIATQDWHPKEHVSFTIWPSHCVQGTTGADFHKGLDLKPVNLIVRKGFRVNIDSYSAFFENDRETSTGLDGFLKALSINTLVLGGLATDYCVLYSALDAIKLGYKTIIAADAIRAVNNPAGSAEQAFGLFNKAGITIIDSKEIK